MKGITLPDGVAERPCPVQGVSLEETVRVRREIGKNGLEFMIIAMRNDYGDCQRGLL